MTLSVLKRNVLLYAAPFLLTVVAVTQRYLAYTSHLSSWMGGGFGMFATYPTATRKMSITLISPDKSEIRILPSEIDERVAMQGRITRIEREVIIHPSPQRLEELSRELANSEWIAVRGMTGKTPRLVPGLAQDFLGNRSDAVPFPVAAVRVEVWSYTPDFRLGKLTRSQLAAMSVEAEDVGNELSR